MAAAVGGRNPGEFYRNVLAFVECCWAESPAYDRGNYSRLAAVAKVGSSR